MLKDNNNNNNNNNRICFICLEDDSIEENSLIEYNHCGIYYIHNDCLNNWDPNDCLICRKKIIPIEEEEQSSAEPIERNINTLIESRPVINNNRPLIVKILIFFVFITDAAIVIYYAFK